MIDIGLSSIDSSEAIAINDRGQVLGSFQEGADRYLFLWDENNGLKVIDYPPGTRSGYFKLNNNGQIACVLWDNSSSIGRVFYWDVSSGFWELKHLSGGREFENLSINDNGQILGTLNPGGRSSRIILFDDGKKIDLTNLFYEQFPGKWGSLQAVSLNNHGHVIFNAYKEQKSPGDQNTGHKAFIWKNGIFSMIMPEISFETSMQCECIDDNGNMIVSCFPKRGGENRLFFVNEEKKEFFPCHWCEKIINNQPISVRCLPGEMKKDRKGNPYFSNGIEIKKLLQEELPYYNVRNSAEIRDQNSSGYVIGLAETMYSRGHAFLAVPD